MILNPWFQLIASLISMIMIANLQYAWTLFVGPIQQANPWSLPDVQWAFSLFVLFQTWVQPLVGWTIDRLGPRRCITAAGILCGAGWAAMGYVSSLPQLYIAYVVAGIGAAMVYSGCIGSALKWFPTRRGFASGVIAAGFGGGTALFIPIITSLIKQQSYREAFLYTGVFQGLVIAVAAQFLRHPDRSFSPPAASAAVKTNARRNSEHFTTAEMLRTPHFYLLYVMFVAIATGGLVLTAQVSPLGKIWKIAPAVVTLTLTLNPIANAVSRIGWGWVSDKTGREIAMAAVFFLQGLLLIAVVAFGTASGNLFTLTIVLAFLTWGEVFSLFPSTSGDYFGSTFATSNYGVLYSAKGAAAIIAGFAAGVYLRYQSWNVVFYFCAGMAFLASVLALVLRAQSMPSRSTARAVRGISETAKV